MGVVYYLTLLHLHSPTAALSHLEESKFSPSPGLKKMGIWGLGLGPGGGAAGAVSGYKRLLKQHKEPDEEEKALR